MVRILDAQGNAVVKYAYDPWGVPTIEGDKDLAAINPCSYRGYYYDEETGYYYLQSRYYDPAIGRFINADTYEYLGSSNSSVSYNLFAYCNNAPVMFSDPTGHVITLVIMGVSISVEAVYLICALVAVLIPFLVQLMRDLPRILYKIGEMIGDLLDALQPIIEKAQNTYRRYGYNNHHIIAKLDRRAEVSRLIWTESCNMSINHSRNIARIKTTLHVFLHTTSYHEAVTALVASGYATGGKSGVLEMVDFIRTVLLWISAFYI